jgi:site-specific recombinase XerC
LRAAYLRDRRNEPQRYIETYRIHIRIVGKGNKERIAFLNMRRPQLQRTTFWSETNIAALDRSALFLSTAAGA